MSFSFNNALNEAVLAEKFGVNRDKYVHSPKKLRSSDMFEGGNASRKTAVFSGSGLTKIKLHQKVTIHFVKIKSTFHNVMLALNLEFYQIIYVKFHNVLQLFLNKLLYHH